MILRLAVVALLAFMTLPTVVVLGVSFNPTAILSFPPAGFSLFACACRSRAVGALFVSTSIG